MKSITYYILLIIIKIKGIKKTYSKSPIDYLALLKMMFTLLEKNYFPHHLLKPTK